MSLLLINLVVLAVVAAAGVFAYAQVLRACEAEDRMRLAVRVDYGALQAHWRGRVLARDWDSLQAQVRRWQEADAPGVAVTECEQVARNLNQSVFRFAVPGEPLALGRTAAEASAAVAGLEPASCPARLRGRGRA